MCRLKAPEINSQLLGDHLELTVAFSDRYCIRPRQPNSVPILDGNVADESDLQMTSRRGSQRAENDLVERVEATDHLDPVDCPASISGISEQPAVSLRFVSNASNQAVDTRRNRSTRVVVQLACQYCEYSVHVVLPACGTICGLPGHAVHIVILLALGQSPQSRVLSLNRLSGTPTSSSSSPARRRIAHHAHVSQCSRPNAGNFEANSEGEPSKYKSRGTSRKTFEVSRRLPGGDTRSNRPGPAPLPAGTRKALNASDSPILCFLGRHMVRICLDNQRVVWYNINLTISMQSQLTSE